MLSQTACRIRLVDKWAVDVHRLSSSVMLKGKLTFYMTVRRTEEVQVQLHLWNITQLQVKLLVLVFFSNMGLLQSCAGFHLVCLWSENLAGYKQMQMEPFNVNPK